MKNLIFSLALILLLFVSQKAFSQNQFWELISLPGQKIYQLEIDRQNHFYAISESAGMQSLLRSDDGISWEMIFPPFTGSLLILIDTTNLIQDKLYLLKQVHVYPYHVDSLFYSNDSGESWELHSLPALDPADNIREFAYNSYGALYIPTYNNIQYTTNNGDTWEIINPPEGSQADRRLQIDIQGNIYTNKTGFIDPQGPWEKIWKSTNNGSTWIGYLSTWAGGENFSAFKTLSGGEMFAGIFADPDDRLFFKKYPDQNWIIKQYNTAGSMIINKYKYIYVSKWWAWGANIPSKYSPDYGTTWFDFDDGNLTIYNLMLENQGFLYAATTMGIYRSIESTFPIASEFSIEFPETAVYDTSSQPIKFFNPFSSQLVVDSVSINNEDFHLGTTPPFVLEPGDSELVNLYFIPTAWGSYSDTLIIYSNLKTQYIFLAGNSPTPELLVKPTWIVFGQTIVDSTKIKTIKITNHSINFLEIDTIFTSLPQFSVTSLNFPVYIVSDSINLDISFTPDSNITYVDTLQIVSNLITYKLSLAGRGVLPVSIVNEIQKIYKFDLGNNFPNPFNPTTKIKYQLPELSKVKLTVYDILGLKIKTLVNEEKPAGSYEVEFDGSRLPSGIYFYRIEAGKFSDTKKFILLK